MGDSGNPGPPRQGGGVVGLGPAAAYRPTAGFTRSAPRTITQKDQDELSISFRLPGWGRKLRIIVFRTKAAGDVTAYFKELLDKANVLFRRHGLRVEVNDRTFVPLVHSGPVTSSEDIDTVLKEVAGNALSSELKVIFCTRQTPDSTAPPAPPGETVKDDKGVKHILINVQNSKPDRVTLAHEMGHCAGLDHTDQDLHARYGYAVDAFLRSRHIQPDENFMSDKNERTRADLFAFQVNALSVAFFSAPGDT